MVQGIGKVLRCELKDCADVVLHHLAEVLHEIVNGNELAEILLNGRIRTAIADGSDKLTPLGVKTYLLADRLLGLLIDNLCVEGLTALGVTDAVHNELFETLNVLDW